MTTLIPIEAIEGALTGEALIAIEEQANGINGTPTLTGVRNTVLLNTLTQNTITGASLTTNQITLPAGTYRVSGAMPVRVGSENNFTQIGIIRDITNGVDLIQGTSTSTSDVTTTYSLFKETTITLTGTTTIEMQMVGTSTALLGAASAGSFGLTNVYSYLVVRKEAEVSNAGSGGPIAEMLIQNQQAAGVEGTTVNSGTYTTIDLNTIVKNTILGSSLVSNQITLPAGTYRVNVRSPMYNNSAQNPIAIGTHKCRLRDAGDTTTLINGSNNFSARDDSSSINTANQGDSIIFNQEIVLATATTFELQHYVSRGQGVAGRANLDAVIEVPNIYAEVYIEQLV